MATTRRKKGPSKQERVRMVLLGLVESYLEDGEPVGSETLRKKRFPDLSSATLRNYFSQLEKDGYLMQQHTSGGRIPTTKGYCAYTSYHQHNGYVTEKQDQVLKELSSYESLDLVTFLQAAAQTLTQLTNGAAFLASPRFDQDFVEDIKLLQLDTTRLLVVLITHFGTIRTEILNPNFQLAAGMVKKLEAYFLARIHSQLDQIAIDADLVDRFQDLFNEVITRFLVYYGSFSHDEVYRSGLSNLLHFKELKNAQALADCLSLFDEPQRLKKLLRNAMTHKSTVCLIGDDLKDFVGFGSSCTALVAPCFVNYRAVGAIGCMTGICVDYRNLFGLVSRTAEAISNVLSRVSFKHQLNFRASEAEAPDVTQFLLEYDEKPSIEYQ